MVGSVAVHLVGGAVDERRVGAVASCRLEKVQGAGRVDREVGLRVVSGPVVRRLRSRVYDELDAPSVAGEQSVDAVGVADVQFLLLESEWVPLHQ